MTGRRWAWRRAAGLVALGFGLFVLSLAGASQPADAPSAVAEARHALFIFPGGQALEVHVLVDTSVADPDEVMAGIEAGMPVPAVEEDEVEAAFAILYKWAAEDIPVEMRHWPGADPVGIDGAAVAAWAGGVWNAVPFHAFSFTYAGLTAVQPPNCTAGGGGPPPADGENGVGFGALQSGVLGVTCGYYSLFHQVDGYSRIFEFDILLNSSGIPWSGAGITPPGMYDVYSTMLHEFGHALGLGHSAVPNVVMSATLGTGQQRRVPQPDDINGVWELYGTGVPATETPSPTSTATASPSPSPMPTATPTATPTPTPIPFRMLLPGMTRD